MAGGQGAGAASEFAWGRPRYLTKKILVYSSPHTAEPELESQNARCTLDSKQTVGAGF